MPKILVYNNSTDIYRVQYIRHISNLRHYSLLILPIIVTEGYHLCACLIKHILPQIGKNLFLCASKEYISYDLVCDGKDRLQC